MKKIEITKANDSSDTLKAAQLYIENGLSVIPIKADGTKAPAISSWKPYQNKQAKHAEIAEWFRNGNGVAIVSGKVSGNLEIIDFDEPELFGPWSDLVHKAYPDLLSNLPVVQTPSGGCHIYYRCAEIENNQKLAQARTENKTKTLIETRGEGGYVLTYPSPANCHHSGKLYTMRVGDLNAIPEITINERRILLDFARSFNQITKIKKGRAEYEAAFATHLGQRSGDVFNRCADWHDILEPHGWISWWKTSDGKRYWRRPDKEGTGISATSDYNGSNVLYVFSSNAEPFEANRSYSKFAAYTLLDHAGNYRAAAKALAIDGYGTAQRYKQPNAQTALERVHTAEPIGLFDAATNQSQFNPKLWQARLTDAGNAECMATLFGNAFKYCHTRNLWLYWDSTRWVPDQCNRNDAGRRTGGS